MNHTILRTTATLSLAGMVMFNAAAPVLAQGNKEQAHQSAPGFLKQVGKNSEINSPVISDSTNQTIAHNTAGDNNGLQVAQQHQVGNSETKQLVALNSQNIKTAQEVNSDDKDTKPQANIQGFNGTIKVGDYVLGNGPDGNPGNKPHLPCVFEIEAYGFDAGVKKVNYVISSQAPTNPKFEVIKSGSFDLDQDDNSYGGSDRGFDGKVVLNLSELLKDYSYHPKQGYHVKVEVTFDGQPSHAGKHKVFWVEKCSIEETNGGTTTPTVTPTPEEKGEMLSTSTSKPATGVMGASIERGANLPSTGGTDMAVAQAFGLFLMVLGGAIAWGKRVAAQRSY